MIKLLKIASKNRERIVTIAINEIKRRYVGSMGGVLWTIIEPLSIILIFSLIFPFLLKVGFKEWVVFFIAGLIPYRFLNRGSLEVVRSLAEYRNILEKMKIEAEEIILARTFSNFIYFLIEMVVFFPIVLFFHAFSINILLFPILFVSLTCLVLSFGFLFSFKCVKYKDIEYILGILFQLFFFISPIVYRPENLPQLLRDILILFPISSIIYCFHLIFFQNLSNFKQMYPLYPLLIYSFSFSLALLFISYKLFMKEKVHEE